MAFRGAVFLVALILAGSIPVCAEQAVPWKGNLELSYSLASGNSDSQTLVTSGKVERRFQAGILSGEARGAYGRKGDTTSDKNWLVRAKYNHFLSARASIFAQESVERDTLKGIEYRYVHQGGIGYVLLQGDRDEIRVEGGAGYTREDRIGSLADQNFPTGRIYAAYSHAFDAKTRFEQSFEYLPRLDRADDYLMNEESALITNLMGSLALRLSFSMAYDNVPPEDFQKLDRLFKTSILYTF